MPKLPRSRSNRFSTSNSSRQGRPAKQHGLREKLLKAIEYLSKGEPARAADMLRKVLKAAPGNFDALHLMGITQNALNRHAEAEKCLKRAIKINPDHADAYNNLGIALDGLKRHNDSIGSYQKAIAISPDHAESYSNQGIALNALNRHEEAIECFQRAISIIPGHANAYCNMGIAFNDLKQHQEAIQCCQRAIEIQPDHADAYCNLGVALNALKRHEESIDKFQRAISIVPDHANAYCSMGIALNDLKRHDHAIECFQRSIEISPEDANSYSNLGIAFYNLRQHEEAIECYRRAIKFRPDHGVSYINLGITLKALKRNQEAIDCYEQAIKIQPDEPSAYSNLGNVLNAQKRYVEAIDCYRRVIQIDSSHPMATSELAYNSRMICDWSDYAGMSKDLDKHVGQSLAAINPFVFLSFSDEPASQLLSARQYAGYKDFPHSRSGSSSRAVKDERIRVAYVSADFREHPVAYQIAELFELHDRDKFEIIGVSLGNDDNSAIGNRLRQSFDRFIDVQAESDQSAAELIAKEGVHIVVDLNGYTQDSRPEIFSHRPAPVQVNYLGYPGTMGADFIDYIIVDPHIVPEDQQMHFSEKLVHLPDTYMVTDSKAEIAAKAPPRSVAGLPDEGFVYCCFHNPNKITPDIFDCWLRLLEEVPGSILWLRIDNETALDNLRKAAVEHGIDAGRLVTADRVDMTDHYARHRLADIYLDTLPYNAHSSACDALWAGLPVLTCSGKTFAARVAGSLLHALEMPELITNSLEEYEALALKLARDPELLNSMHDKLAKNRLTTALFDSKRFCSNLEEAYVQMYERWSRDEDHKPIKLKPVEI